jgi:cell division protein FtsB
LELAKAELADATAERSDIEHHVRMLGDASLDLDLLDEQSRRMSGLASGDEVVYFPKR